MVLLKNYLGLENVAVLAVLAVLAVFAVLAVLAVLTVLARRCWRCWRCWRCEVLHGGVGGGFHLRYSWIDRLVGTCGTQSPYPGLEYLCQCSK